ncbi:hypothetical protein ACFL60_03550 [Candidatus Omnitrophota bacterium]
MSRCGFISTADNITGCKDYEEIRKDYEGVYCYYDLLLTFYFRGINLAKRREEKDYFSLS